MNGNTPSRDGHTDEPVHLMTALLHALALAGLPPGPHDPLPRAGCLAVLAQLCCDTRLPARYALGPLRDPADNGPDPALADAARPLFGDLLDALRRQHGREACREDIATVFCAAWVTCRPRAARPSGPQVRRRLPSSLSGPFVRTFGVALGRYWDPVTGFDLVRFDQEVARSGSRPLGEVVIKRYGHAAADLLVEVLTHP